MKLQLTNSDREVIVDDEDYTRVMSYKWYGRGANRQTIVSTNPPQKPLANFIMHNFDVKYDHRNSNAYDFQKENLREITQQQNLMNASKQKRFLNPCTSRYKGVHWNRATNSWRCRMSKNGIYYHLGLFATEELAAEAYNRKAKELFGEFAKLNQIPKH